MDQCLKHLPSSYLHAGGFLRSLSVEQRQVKAILQELSVVPLDSQSHTSETSRVSFLLFLVFLFFPQSVDVWDQIFLLNFFL